MAILTLTSVSTRPADAASSSVLRGTVTAAGKPLPDGSIVGIGGHGGVPAQIGSGLILLRRGPRQPQQTQP
jgi:hypothetical protein